MATDSKAKPDDGITRQEMNDFLDELHRGQMEIVPGHAPLIEASRKIIEHYNRGVALEHFDTAGYFVIQGVKVCEVGKREQTEKRLATTIEQVVFGGGMAR